MSKRNNIETFHNVNVEYNQNTNILTILSDAPFGDEQLAEFRVVKNEDQTI